MTRLYYQAKPNFMDGSRERNEVKRPDQPVLNPVTALRSVPGFHWKTILALACSLLLCPGCQKSTIKTVPIEVTVKYKGETVEGALVTFNPVEKGSPVRAASGMTNADGKVTPLTPPGLKGVVPGRYKVTIMKTPAIGGSGSSDSAPAPQSYEEALAASRKTNSGGMNVDAQHQLPQKYAAESTTDLEVTVEKKDSLTFDLED